MGNFAYDLSCAAIHDLSGFGKCSLTVALPVLSACGVETSALPTAVLSTHTGGFEGFTYRDLTADLLPIARHWQSIGASFGAVYSGFLGSGEQIGMVEEIISMFRTPRTLVLVDPVMGDGGRLYQTYTPAMADGMVRLCRRADAVAPNMTEACHILGLPYDPGPYTEEFLRKVLHGLCGLGPHMAVITGACLREGELGAACLDAQTGKMSLSVREQIPGFFHGTGDLFASVLLGGLLNGMALEDACDTAVEFTHRTIVTTAGSGVDTRFGPKFETHLGWLSGAMARARGEGVEHLCV